MIVWSGFGIIVPILFVVVGLLFSWISGDPDTRFSNPGIMGWTMLITGVLTLLIGLAMRGSKDENGNRQGGGHSFFWIPVWIWGPIFLVLGIVFMFKGRSSSSSSSSSDTDANPAIGQVDETPEPVAKPTTRKVHLYNPSNEDLIYVISDETSDGLVDKDTVEAGGGVVIELDKGTYTFASFDMKGKTKFAPPLKADASDETRYTKFTDDKGDFYQRIVGAATKENDDYDEAWFMMDGKTSMISVNVTAACDPDVTESDIRKADWVQSIHREYPGSDLTEPMYKQFIKDKQIIMVSPFEELPETVAENEVVYLLVPYKGEKNKNAVIATAIIESR